MIDRRIIKNFDFPLLLATIFLILIGILIIFSASSKENEMQKYFIRQSYFLIISLIVFFSVLNIHYETFDRWAYIFYIFSIILLLSVYFFPAQAGARRWITFGSFGIQPAELAKISLIFTLGQYLKRNFGKIKKFKDLIVPFILTGIPIILILKQPDLGTALTFIPIFLSMLYLSGLPFLYIFLIISPMISLIFYNWLYLWIGYIIFLLFFLWWRCNNGFDSVLAFIINTVSGILGFKLLGLLKTYQKKRLLAFIYPELDPLGSGYHLIQSKIAIGSGGFMGKGFMSGSQNKLDFLPAQHTDFIFSVVGEEFGFIGSFFLIMIFSFIILRGIDIAAKAKNIYGALISVGIISVFSFHIIVNIGMTVGIMPITGIPLPFISYGGSSLLGFMIMIALLINVSMRRFD